MKTISQLKRTPSDQSLNTFIFPATHWSFTFPKRCLLYHDHHSLTAPTTGDLVNISSSSTMTEFQLNMLVKKKPFCSLKSVWKTFSPTTSNKYLAKWTLKKTKISTPITWHRINQ